MHVTSRVTTVTEEYPSSMNTVLDELITSESMKYESNTSLVRCRPKTVAVAVVFYFFLTLDMSSEQVTLSHYNASGSEDRPSAPQGWSPSRYHCMFFLFKKTVLS